PQFGVAGSAGERVMIYRPQAEGVVQDEQGELRLRMNERGRVLKATSPDGEVVFEGPIDTAEQREALPGDLRARLEKFEQLPVLDEPVEPPAGFSPGADVGQMMTTDVVM